MKLMITGATVASLLTFGAFSPLAVGQQPTATPAQNVAHDSVRPPTQRTFKQQAAAAMARLLPPTAPRSPAPTSPAADPTPTAGARAADPLLQLNAAYYNQSRELAKIATKLPPVLRAEVERDIESLQAKRQALMKVRQRNMARQGTTRSDMAGTDPARPTATRPAAARPATARSTTARPAAARPATARAIRDSMAATDALSDRASSAASRRTPPGISPRRAAGTTPATVNGTRRELGSAAPAGVRRAPARAQAPAARPRPAAAGAVRRAPSPSATPGK